MHLLNLAIATLAGSALATLDPQARRRHHARLAIEEREFRGGGRNDSFVNAVETPVPSDSVSASLTASASIASSSDSSSTSISLSADPSSLSSSAPASVSSNALSASQSSSSSASSVTTTSAVSAVASPLSTSSTSSAIASPVSQAGPSTLSNIASTPTTQTTSTKILTTPALVTTVRSTASSSATAAASEQTASTSGLSKPAIIAIVVVAVCLALIAIGFTLFRKMKLAPSGRFNSKMKAIDFGPHATTHDDFMEKTLHRSHSNTSAAAQRNLLASEVDSPNPNVVAGIPEHDFTANPAHLQGQPGVYDMYNQDPYYHAEAYEYEGAYGQNGGNAYGASYAQPAGTYAYGQNAQEDQPVVEGYANLQRGNSGGSGSGHGHSAHSHTHVQQAVSPEMFPNPESYLGRPTGHNEGPYAQAAQYRAY